MSKESTNRVQQHWIKLDRNIADKQETKRIAIKTGLDIDSIIGRMARFWIWVDGEWETDLFEDATAENMHIATGIGDPEFWNAVESVGWIQFTDAGAVIPEFDKRFSQSAKNRMKANDRQQKSRSKKRKPEDEDDPSVTPKSQPGHTDVTPVSHSCHADVTPKEKELEKEKEINTPVGRVLHSVTREMLSSPEQLATFHEQLAAADPARKGDLRRVLAKAYHARGAPKGNPVKIFVAAVRDRNFAMGSSEADDWAREAELQLRRDRSPPLGGDAGLCAAVTATFSDSELSEIDACESDF